MICKVVFKYKLQGSQSTLFSFSSYTQLGVHGDKIGLLECPSVHNKETEQVLIKGFSSYTVFKSFTCLLSKMIPKYF